MVNVKDVVIGLVSLALVFYGGQTESLFVLMTGIFLIVLTLILTIIGLEKNIEDNKEQIRILNAQLNTKSELDKIWRELNEFKKNKRKKRNN
ncbi:hypothetical protein JXB41_00070 [Candidatus Woesearchaeota archaeon]|nr:hypothetical protein [Candidatus Woesearchaeota archaeon]